MLKGRAFQQALTEALWAVPVARAYRLAHHLMEPERAGAPGRRGRGNVRTPSKTEPPK